jgi:hypothetical protein
MNRALENIRKRIDAFGTAEPTLFVTGNTIEVQIPGLARGTIDERAKKQYCLVGESSESFGCFSTQGDGQAQLNAVVVKPLVQSVCLTGDVLGASAPCFGTDKDAQTAIDAIAVEPSTDPATTGQFCITGTGLGTDPCFPPKKQADAALAGIGTATTQTWCLQGQGDTTLASDLGAACEPTQAEAQAKLDAISLKASDSQFCVVSSAGVNLGCFLSRELAQAKLQETGQERLLQVIGTTARLEQRAVIATLTPPSRLRVTPVTARPRPRRSPRPARSKR